MLAPRHPLKDAWGPVQVTCPSKSFDAPISSSAATRRARRPTMRSGARAWHRGCGGPGGQLPAVQTGAGLRQRPAAAGRQPAAQYAAAAGAQCEPPPQAYHRSGSCCICSASAPCVSSPQIHLQRVGKGRMGLPVQGLLAIIKEAAPCRTALIHLLLLLQYPEHASLMLCRFSECAMVDIDQHGVGG